METNWRIWLGGKRWKCSARHSQFLVQSRRNVENCWLQEWCLLFSSKVSLSFLVFGYNTFSSSTRRIRIEVFFFFRNGPLYIKEVQNAFPTPLSPSRKHFYKECGIIWGFRQKSLLIWLSTMPTVISKFHQVTVKYELEKRHIESILKSLTL